MTRWLARQASPGPRGDALEQTLRSDPADFLAQLKALDPQARATLWQAGAGRAWCKVARDRDRVELLLGLQALAAADDAIEHLPAWSRSPAALGAEGWRAEKPMLALLHVGSGGAMVRSWQRRFDHAPGWQKLVDERCITPRAYTERFGVSVPLLRRWCDQGVLSRTAFATLLQSDADAVVQAAVEGKIDTGEILHRCATEQEAGVWAARFLQAGVGPCPLWVERRPAWRNASLAAALQGSLSTDQYLRCVPRPDSAAMQALCAADKAGPLHVLRAGLLDDAGIMQLVHQGMPPQQVIREGFVPAGLARAWVAQGVVDKADFVKASLVHWRIGDAMPPYHHEAALQALGPYSFLRNLALPTAPAARSAYAARLLAVHLWHRQSPLVWEARQTAAAAPDASASVGGAGLASVAAQTCGVCLESFNDKTQPAELVACAHAPALCRTCLLEYVQKSDDAYPVCVAPGCKKPILPEDVIRAGGTPNQAHELALHGVRRHLAHSVVWWGCPTRGCPGGTLLGVEVGNNYHCRVCEKVSFVRTPEVDWRRDAEKILRLIDGLRAYSATSEGRIRECPQCGVATEHDGGCAHMKCRECGVNWNFSTGLTTAYAAGGLDGEQTYVPRAGLLVLAGLYDNVTPGPGLLQAVLANAKRLQLLPEPTQKRTQPPRRMLLAPLALPAAPALVIPAAPARASGADLAPRHAEASEN